MENEFELLTYEKLRHMKIFLNQITYRNFHTHSAFELLWVLEGQGEIRFRDGAQALRPGGMVIVNPHEAHEIDAQGGQVLCMIYQFSRHFCQEYYPRLQSVRFLAREMTETEPAEWLADCRRHMSESALAFWEEPEAFPLICISHTAALLHGMLTRLPYSLLTEQEHIKRGRNIQRMRRISAFLEENYQRPIRLEELARREGLTQTYISHLFTEQYGVSFQEYLTSLRFEKAMSYLPLASMSLTDIALCSGFSDLKYLRRAFEKRIGCTLREYRQSLDGAASPDTLPVKNLLERKFTPAESVAYFRAHAMI